MPVLVGRPLGAESRAGNLRRLGGRTARLRRRRRDRPNSLVRPDESEERLKETPRGEPSRARADDGENSLATAVPPAAAEARQGFSVFSARAAGGARRLYPKK